jgi:hypothetical protein
VSSTPIYFQWQNEALMQTIYPLREMKLRDFLVFYNEIDVWAQYKSKTIADIRDEVEAYRETLTRNWAAAYDLTQKYKAEFTRPSAAADYHKKYPKLDPELERRSNLLFNTFTTYLPKVKDVRNERYFIAQRISEWETTRKWVAKKIEQHQRTLRNMPANWVHRPKREQELAELEKFSLPMADEVLEKMYAYLSAMVKIEKRRVEMQKWRAGKEKDKVQMAQRRQKALQEAQTLENQHRKAAEALKRVKNPPDLAALEAHFAKLDISAEYKALLGETDAAFTTKANQVHQAISSYFKTVANPASRVFFLKGQISQVEVVRRQKETRIAEIERTLSNMAPTWARRPQYEEELGKLRSISMPMIESELSKLVDLQAALESAGKTPDQSVKTAAEAEKTYNELDTRLRTVQSEAASLETEIRLLEETVGKPEKEQLLAFLSAQPITVNDIVMGKMEEYRLSLQGKDQYELLELIIQRFQQDPKRYPLWLQYMVVHFSGMRYQSAHGSWADPKDLLLSLRLKDIDKELKRADNDAIEALCEEKLAIYDPGTAEASSAQAGPKAELPALAKAQEARWKDKLGIYVQRMRSPSPYTRRSALLNLRTDEENYAIDKMSDKEALAALEEIKDDLPEWMWKEIVRLTDLRLKEVSDKNWETLTPDEQEERMNLEYRELRQVMDDWKRKHLTGWREEHDRANKLIVTRAVCNEVAEHIQHLRGHTPPGGLTAKPEWYRRKESDPKLAGGAVKPFWIKPKAPSDFKPGASILWLRFVHGEPNPWRIAHPVLVRGEGLLSPGLIGRSGAARPGHSPGPNDPGSWSYTQDSRSFRRTRTSRDARGQSIREEQWLRWIHEATVVEVAETAEGTVVLTFETALPYEDKRLSTIGVFKHHINAVQHSVTPFSFIASFEGYVPEGELPYDDLREMLDWNKVLLKGYVSEAELREFQAKAGIVGMRSLGPRRVEASLWLEAAPPLGTPETHREAIQCYTVDSRSRQAEAYEPEVALPRGTLLKASLTHLVRLGDETYYPVTECESEPRAQELYVRKSECIDITSEQEPYLVQVQQETTPYTLVGLGARGKPRFRPVKRLIPAGTKLRVSSKHKLIESGPGDGVLGPDARGRTYRLIVDCPGRSSVNGLFVRVDDVKGVVQAG